MMFTMTLLPFPPIDDFGSADPMFVTRQHAPQPLDLLERYTGQLGFVYEGI